jgi:dephospho-CoA kinase
LNIGVSGPIGAGKTTAAKYLAETYGLSYLRYSEILAETLPGPARDRQTLRDFGWDMMWRGTQSALNERVLTKMRPGINYVVDGLRHPIDFEMLSTRPPFYLLYLDASPQIRWQRLSSREKSKTWDEFSAIEKHPVESYLPILQEKAYKILLNQGCITEFHADLDAIFTDMRTSVKP